MFMARAVAGDYMVERTGARRRGSVEGSFEKFSKNVSREPISRGAHGTRPDA